jgi:hypothetical protein
MKNRLSWSLLFLLLFAAPIRADLVKCLVVQLSNDTKLYYPTAYSPVASFVGTVLHLNTDVMDITTVAKMTIETVELVGIHQPETNGDKLVNNGQTLLLRTSQSKVQIYNLSGRSMQTAIIQQGDLYSIDLSELASGTYLLKAGQQSWKFIKH